MSEKKSINQIQQGEVCSPVEGEEEAAALSWRFQFSVNSLTSIWVSIFWSSALLGMHPFMQKQFSPNKLLVLEDRSTLIVLLLPQHLGQPSEKVDVFI